jgi:hypothetical protein
MAQMLKIEIGIFNLRNLSTAPQPRSHLENLRLDALFYLQVITHASPVTVSKSSAKTVMSQVSVQRIENVGIETANGRNSQKTKLGV